MISAGLEDTSAGTGRHLRAADFVKQYVKASDLGPFVKQAVLYGSCARGEARYESDVDILFVLTDEAEHLPGFGRMTAGIRSYLMANTPEDVEPDVKFVFRKSMEEDRGSFLSSVRREGIPLL